MPATQEIDGDGKQQGQQVHQVQVQQLQPMHDMSQQRLPPPQLQPSPSQQAAGQQPAREEWSDEATDVVLEVWAQKHIQLNRGKLKKQEWDEVAGRVTQILGGGRNTKSWLQCKNKIDSIKKKYKAVRGQRASGGVRREWRLFEKVEYLLGAMGQGVSSPGGRRVSDGDGGGAGSAIVPPTDGGKQANTMTPGGGSSDGFRHFVNGGDDSNDDDDDEDDEEAQGQQQHHEQGQHGGTMQRGHEKHQNPPSGMPLQVVQQQGHHPQPQGHHHMPALELTPGSAQMAANGGALYHNPSPGMAGMAPAHQPGSQPGVMHMNQHPTSMPCNGDIRGMGGVSSGEKRRREEAAAAGAPAPPGHHGMHHAGAPPGMVPMGGGVPMDPTVFTPFQDLAAAVREFAAVYERVERLKMDRSFELERMRMEFAKEMEVQRMQVQLEVARLGPRAGPGVPGVGAAGVGMGGGPVQPTGHGMQ